MSNFQDFSDNDLVAIYQKDKDLVVIGELFKRYKHVVIGICLKYLKDKAAAEDALMEVFEELIKSLQKADIRQFKPWLGTVTRNYLHRQHKIKSRILHTSLEEIFIKSGDEIMELSENDTPYNEKAEIEQKEAELLKAVNSLKKEQAECVKLFFLENNSYVDVCKKTGYSFKEVKSFIQNGKRNLKKKLEG